jgi:hypothetical protein
MSGEECRWTTVISLHKVIYVRQVVETTKQTMSAEAMCWSLFCQAWVVPETFLELRQGPVKPDVCLHHRALLCPYGARWVYKGSLTGCCDCLLFMDTSRASPGTLSTDCGPEHWVGGRRP